LRGLALSIVFMIGSVESPFFPTCPRPTVSPRQTPSCYSLELPSDTLFFRLFVTRSDVPFFSPYGWPQHLFFEPLSPFLFFFWYLLPLRFAGPFSCFWLFFRDPQGSVSLFYGTSHPCTKYVFQYSLVGGPPPQFTEVGPFFWTICP